MAAINLHGARSDLSNLGVRLSRFPSFCTLELTVGTDTICLFLDGKHADKAQVLVDLIKDNLEQVPVEPVLDPV